MENLIIQFLFFPLCAHVGFKKQLTNMEVVHNGTSVVFLTNMQCDKHDKIQLRTQRNKRLNMLETQPIPWKDYDH